MAKEDEDEKKKEEEMAAEEAAAEAPAEEAATDEAPAEAPAEDGGEPGEEQTVGSSLRDDGTAPRAADTARLQDMLADEFRGKQLGATQQLLNEIADKMNAERKDIKDLAEQAPAAPDLADLVVALLPVALGAAVGGKRGALAAGVGGLEGMVESRDKRKAEIAKQIEAKEKYIQTLEGRAINLQGRVAAALAGKEGFVPQAVLQQATGFMGAAINAQQLLDFIDTYFPETSTKESYKQWAKRKLQVEFGNELTNEAIFENLLAALRLDLQSGVKGVPSNKDQQLIDTFLQGAGEIDTLPKIRAALEASVKRLTANANLTTKNYQMLQQGQVFTVDDVKSYANEVRYVGVEEKKKQEAEATKPKSRRINGVPYPVTMSNGAIINMVDLDGEQYSLKRPWVNRFLKTPENISVLQNLKNLPQKELDAFEARFRKARDADKNQKLNAKQPQ